MSHSLPEVGPPAGNRVPAPRVALAVLCTHINGVCPGLLALVLVLAAVGRADGGPLVGVEVGAVERAVGAEGRAILVEVVAADKC